MSILNHFGKVKTTFVPYKSKYHRDGIKIFYPHRAPNNSTPVFTYYTTPSTKSEQFRIELDEPTFIKYHELMMTQGSDALGHTGRREHIIQDFADIIKKITDKFTSTIWATLNASPLLTISELLWLKVDDVDSRVDHLEKIIAQVIDDNKLLQRKVDALEQQKRLRESRDAKFKRVLIQELD